MMQQALRKIVWLFALWMLCSIAPVAATPQASQPAAWRTTPTLSGDVCPTYRFQSTSSLAPVVGTTSYTSTAVYTPGAIGPNRAKKDEEWDDPDPNEPGVGEVVAQPLGEPWLLLLLAGLLILYRKKRTA